jgi:hypothetical protein
LEEATKVWKSIRVAVRNILDNESVKMFLKDIMTYAQLLLSELVDESKTWAENLKNYVLQAVPQQEFQRVVEAIADYVEKKARNQAVDDADAIRDIYDKLVVVLKKVGTEFFSVDVKEGSLLARVCFVYLKINMICCRHMVFILGF